MGRNKRCTIRLNGKIILENVTHANTFFTRFRGLMYRKKLNADEGLLLDPCNQIHMFGMRFEIDAIYLDNENRVVHIDENMKINSVGKTIKEAKKILEVNSGFAKVQNIMIDDIMMVE